MPGLREDEEMNDTKANFPPGKNLRAADASLIRTYADRISGGWHHAAEDMMGIARLCLEASQRLTLSAKKELIRQLPFKEAAFSKFVQIGNDAWLHALQAQRLLPPHYTIAYQLTRLTDEELKSALSAGVINPNMKRADLQNWLKARRLRMQNTSPADHSPPIRDRGGAKVVAAKDEGAFAALQAAWSAAPNLQTAWTNATDAARKRFVREVLLMSPVLLASPSPRAVAAAPRDCTQAVTGSWKRWRDMGLTVRGWRNR
jgi:hypothetical protein